MDHRLYRHSVRFFGPAVAVDRNDKFPARTIPPAVKQRDITLCAHAQGSPTAAAVDVVRIKLFGDNSQFDPGTFFLFIFLFFALFYKYIMYSVYYSEQNIFKKS